MKHDVQIVYKKEKSLKTLEVYGNGVRLTEEEKERRKERKRVERILTPTYYANKNAN